ncbi:hypothetical protein B4O83_03545 [Chromohalobacter israelensis]|nr:hypothetical protein B4O83_03545 [Chromohalobacter salexigens]
MSTSSSANWPPTKICPATFSRACVSGFGPRAARSSKLEARSSKLEARSSKLEARQSSCGSPRLS